MHGKLLPTTAGRFLVVVVFRCFYSILALFRAQMTCGHLSTFQHYLSMIQIPKNTLNTNKNNQRDQTQEEQNQGYYDTNIRYNNQK